VPNEAFLILGGGGLVGLQIARRIANDLSPSRVIIASLFREEVEQALSGLRKMFGSRPIEFAGFWGDLFVRQQFARESRGRLLESYASREELFDDLFGPFPEAYKRSQLVQLILEHKPDVIIDSINTATAISYQDVYTASIVSKRKVDAMLEAIVKRDVESARSQWKDTERSFEELLLSQAVPQLIRHVLLIHRAAGEVGTRLGYASLFENRDYRNRWHGFKHPLYAQRR
jgi:hypothetical protein